MPTSKPQLKAYVSADVYAKFKEIAESENRTISNYLEFLVMREIQEHESKSIKSES